MSTRPEIENAHIAWQEDGAPYSSDYGDVYFSRDGGLAETQHVFLQANDLEARWRALDALDRPGVFTVGELGFGTGLNFLSTWQLWQQTGCRRLRLHYISCEKHPLSVEALDRALRQWPELSEYRDALLRVYPDHSGGYHRLPLRLNGAPSGSAAVILDLYYGVALGLLKQQPNPHARVDAWFLDGFTPARNPDLWSDEILHTLAERTRVGGTMSSYSVTGRVVRSLKSLGFEVEKRKGFGAKRQMLFACLRDNTGQQTSPEDISKPGHAAASQHVAIIGAGLAGATVARSLAERGVRVTVLEQHDEVAQGASGNRQAVVQLRLNRQADTHWQFHVHSYLYALRFYHDLSATSVVDIQWHDCGVLTLDSAYANTRRAAATADGAQEYGHYPAQVLQPVSAQDSEHLCGFALDESGLFQPGGGWLNPRACCLACLDHPLITVKTGTGVSHLEHCEGQWQLFDDNGRRVAMAETVVIANSYAARQFSQTAQLPVAPLRGQVSELGATPTSRTLSTVICGERYIAPAFDDRHCVGASYIKASETTDLDEAEHTQNCEKLGALAVAMGFPSSPPLAGRAGIRGSSLDYMPLAGQVPDPDLPELRYGGTQHLGPDKTALPDPAPLSGLFVSTGHGSHGTVSCPLIAEHIASLICREASPLPAALAELIDPVRFVRRARRRQR